MPGAQPKTRIGLLEVTFRILIADLDKSENWFSDAL
jgi:hypothetical protein